MARSPRLLKLNKKIFVAAAIAIKTATTKAANTADATAADKETAKAVIAAADKLFFWRHDFFQAVDAAKKYVAVV